MWLAGRTCPKFIRGLGVLYFVVFFRGTFCAEAVTVSSDLCPVTSAPAAFERHASCWRKPVHCSCSKLSRTVDVFTADVIDFHRNIFTPTTVKVLAATLPLYFAARPADKKVHNIFYCGRRHKNLHQPPRGLTHFLNYAVPISMVALSSLYLFSSDDDLATAARVFGINLPFVWVEKNILKKLFKIDACKRPFNQNFPRKCVYGGCPSGHMVFAWYATIFWGSQQGLSWGIPMGIFSTAVFIDFVASNRHFASQMILGTALGIIYGFAASKAVDCIKKLPIECNFSATDKGRPALEFSYAY